MAKKIQDLYDQRAKATKASRKIMDKAAEEKRKLTDEENKQVDLYLDEVRDLTEEIDRETRVAEAERTLAETAGEEAERQTQDRGEQRELAAITTEFRSFLRTGAIGEEFRALQVDVDTSGGYLAPMEFVARVIQAVDDMTFVRAGATILPLAAGSSVGVPSLDDDPEDFDWTGEISEVDEDSEMSFGQRKLTPHLMSKLVKVSMQLLSQSAIDIEALVIQRLAYKRGITEEKGYLTGNGALQPLGIFTASAQGISTDRDIATNSTTAINFDALFDAKYSIKGNYWNRLAWMFHRDAVKKLAKIKDGEGRYQWQHSVQVGQPDMLLGFPVNMSEYVPNTFSAGSYVGALADLSEYYIADSQTMQIQRLNEKYANKNKVGFIGRAMLDGMPGLEEAFARIKTAAS